MENQRLLASQRVPRVLTVALPSIGNMVFASIFLILVFGIGNGLLNDGDTGYHIRTGEEILKHGRVPAGDIFSAQLPPPKWTAHEWLSEVILAVVYKYSGLTGIVVFFAWLLAATHWLLYFILSRKSSNLILVVIITCLATATSSTHWLARPHVFSLLFTIVWHCLLDRFQHRKCSILLYLPLLMIIWVNLHGGYIFGLLFIGIYLGGNVLCSMCGSREASQEYRGKVKTLFFCLILTVIACGINPRGFEILLFPLKLTSDRFLMDRVVEFLSPNFHEPLPFMYMLLATIGTLAFSRAPLNLVECGLLLLLSYMALYSARYIPLFAVVVAPLLLKSGDSVLGDLPEQGLRFVRTRSRTLLLIDKKVLGCVWPICVTLLVFGLAIGGSLKFSFDDKRFPVAAVNFLNREQITGNMFNNDEFGDYIIFSAWPNYRVFIDGRSDMYGEKLVSAYLQVANVKPGWRETLARYNITWVIFNTHSALTAALDREVDWRAIYTDEVATIFLKESPDHASLLAKYPAVELTIAK